MRNKVLAMFIGHKNIFQEKYGFLFLYLWVLSIFSVIYFVLKVEVSESESLSVMSNSLGSYELYKRWNSPGQNTGEFPSPGDLPNPRFEPRSPSLQANSLPAEPQGKPKNTGVGSLSLLQWIFPTQKLNQGLLHCMRILYQLIYEGRPYSSCIWYSVQFSSVQSLSRVWLFATPWIAACQASMSITNTRSLLALMPIESVMPSSHLILCHPLLLLPPIPPSIRVFSNESTLCMRWPKYWSFSFNISPSSEDPRLIFSRMDWLDLLAVQGTLKSVRQQHSPKASIFQCSAFFTVQLSHQYMTTGKTIALTRRTFVDKVISLLFNMLSRLVITFLPRSKHLLISWL